MRDETMELTDLLGYEDIVIQCHDNPDADALASGYALMYFFAKNGKDVRFIYRGRNQIRKSNLLILIEELQIPVEYAPDFNEEPDLLITVDCQYGQKNVTETKAKKIATVDHHQKTVDLPELSVVRSTVGSCSTVCWDLLNRAGINANEDKFLATALYYGLFTDTNKLSEISHPLDRDMVDALMYNKSVITAMVNANISYEELQITGKAILNHEYHEENRCMLIESEPCDPCILGVIGDFVLETDIVDVSLAFYESPYEIKFSVRSCSKEVHANELAAFIADGLGGGGGHILKAGGSIRPELLEKSAKETIEERLAAYYDSYDVIYAKDTTLDVTKMKRYNKLSQSLGCVKLTDVFEDGTPVNIRTLEGDVDTTIDDDAFLMIGVEGEVYPIKTNKLLSSYQLTNLVYTNTLNYDYEPKIKNLLTGEKKNVIPYAKTVLTKSQAAIYAKKLEKAVKVFTAWTEDKYYTGNIGDYLVVRADDPHDIYIVNGALFNRFYKVD